MKLDNLQVDQRRAWSCRYEAFIYLGQSAGTSTLRLHTTSIGRRGAAESQEAISRKEFAATEHRPIYSHRIGSSHFSTENSAKKLCRSRVESVIKRVRHAQSRCCRAGKSWRSLIIAVTNGRKGYESSLVRRFQFASHFVICAPNKSSPSLCAASLSSFLFLTTFSSS